MIDEMVGMFHPTSDALGRFEPVTADEMPLAYRDLLAHEHHMTVAVEAFHQGPVDVHVLGTQVSSQWYAREILLRRRSDNVVVQYGIMRLYLSLLAPHVQAEVLSERIPLGHILIRHDILRRIELVQLYRVTPGERLTACMELDRPRTTYGRTARIHSGDKLGVELLEIVVPV